MISDFFYPRVGGVEMHIWSLSQHLIRLGHHVVIITHGYGNRQGVRYMAGPLKVYYCPFRPMVDQDIVPTFTATFPLLRWILHRERIQIVHGHQATSVLANESIVYGAELGLATIYTDHSLFGIDNDVASVLLNRVLQTTLSLADAAITVSYSCRDNLVLRAKLCQRPADANMVHVIPNAIDATRFVPDKAVLKARRTTREGQRSNNSSSSNGNMKQRVTVVVVSRLVYRKGVDLLMGIIPRICHDLPYVDFVIAGDGSKRSTLEAVLQQEGLLDNNDSNTTTTTSSSSSSPRVTLLGSIPHSQVHQVLNQGDIFLNCSLTESFCIAVLEAACCGLHVVATNVGGVPEVLPSDMMLLATPTVDDLVDKLHLAIQRQEQTARVRDNGIDNDATNAEYQRRMEWHSRIEHMYSWQSVAEETVRVYRQVLYEQPRRTFLQRLRRFGSIGPVAGLVAMLLLTTFQFFKAIVFWCQPNEIIDIVPELGMMTMMQSKRDDDDNDDDGGDHQEHHHQQQDDR